MIVKQLTEHHLEFLSLKGGCRGSSESTHVKMPHCWKSHALAYLNFIPHHRGDVYHLGPREAIARLFASRGGPYYCPASKEGQ